MEMKATVLEDQGKKPWSMEGRTGESRRVLVRSSTGKILLFKSDPSVDLSAHIDEEVVLHIDFTAGERMLAQPKVVGFDEA